MAGAAAGGGTTAQQPSVFNQSSQALNASMAGTAAGMGYQPQQISAVGYNPAQLQNQSLAPYANPFENQVIGGLQQDAMNQYQNMNNQIGAEATRAGAFGGSRHGVAQGAMATGVQNALNNQIGQLRMGGFQNAQNMALQDINARNAAQQFGASNMMQAQMQNQNAGMMGAQQRLQAANQMGNLSNQAFNMGRQINADMSAQGALQQALQQMVMDKAADQYAGYQNAPMQSLQAATTALGSAGVGAPQTTTSTASQKNGLMDYLGMGLYGYSLFQ